MVAVDHCQVPGSLEDTGWLPVTRLPPEGGEKGTKVPLDSRKSPGFPGRVGGSCLFGGNHVHSTVSFFL